MLARNIPMTHPKVKFKVFKWGDSKLDKEINF